MTTIPSSLPRSAFLSAMQSLNLDPDKITRVELTPLSIRVTVDIPVTIPACSCVGEVIQRNPTIARRRTDPACPVHGEATNG